MISQYWDQVTARLKNVDGVLAYEIMNEPWWGDIYSDPSLLEAGVAVALVTAAGYKGAPEKYEVRLDGLLRHFAASSTSAIAASMPSPRSADPGTTGA